MEIQSRHYLLSYHKNSFYGFWKSLLESPPCKPPNSPRTKEFSYELEAQHDGQNHSLFLHLIGFTEDLDIVERQLSKYTIARLEQPNFMIIIKDRSNPHPSSTHIFREFCRDKGYIMKGTEIHHKEVRDGKEIYTVLKNYR